MKQDAYLPHGGGKQTPELIVIHSMAEYVIDGKPYHAVNFLNKYEYSAHSLIAPEGTNYRCREDNFIAWHAKGFNKNSLGMEILVPGGHDYAGFVERIKTPYVTDEQYVAALAQVKEWLDLWPIKQIKRHSDLSPGRKVDPGSGFDMQGFLHDLGW